MVIAVVPFIVLVVGALMYALPTNSKVAELGRLTFFAGLLVFLFSVAHVTLHLM